MENKPFDPYSQNSFTGMQDSKGVYMKDKLRMMFEKINYYLVRILPSIGNLITFIFFYIKRILTAFIKIALEQLKF